MHIRVPSLSESRDAHPICPPAAAPVATPGPDAIHCFSCPHLATAYPRLDTPSAAAQAPLPGPPTNRCSLTRHPSHLLFPSCLPVSPFIRVISVIRVISRCSSHRSLSFSSLLIQVISRYPNQLPLSESYPIIRVISLYPNYLSHLPSSESYPVIRERIISRCPSHLPLSQSFSLSESSRCPSPLSLSESAPHRHCGLPAGC